MTPHKGMKNNARETDVRQAGIGLFWISEVDAACSECYAETAVRAGGRGGGTPQSIRGAEVTTMKYFTREFIDRMHNSITGLKADPRAREFDEAFYQEMYGRALQKRLEQQRRMRLAQDQDPVESATRRLKPLVDAGVMEPSEFKEHIKRLKDVRKITKEVSKAHPFPPFDEEKITENFNKGLESTLKYYREKLPEEIYRLVADPRVLALGIASPEVKWAAEADKRFVDAAFQAAQAGEAGVPERIVRLLRSHDARVERAVRRGDALTLRFGKDSNYYRVRRVRFSGCEFLKWNDPTGWYWGYQELERLPDGRYLVGVLLQEAGGGLMELELTARDIEIDSSTTLEDIKLKEERIQHLLDIGVLRKATEEDF